MGWEQQQCDPCLQLFSTKARVSEQHRLLNDRAQHLNAQAAAVGRRALVVSAQQANPLSLPLHVAPTCTFTHVLELIRVLASTCSLG